MLARKTNNLPKLMGILNITPDSFSDGGLYFQKPGKALEKIKSLSSDGAEIIDIGAESTRPDAQEISHVQEIERLLPVFEKLVGKVPCQGDLGVDQACLKDSTTPGLTPLPLTGDAQIFNPITNSFRYKKDLVPLSRENRKNPTKAEDLIWKKLLSNKKLLGYRFLRQKPIDSFILDFYCSELLIGIEIDGDYHRKRSKYDALRTYKLEEIGIKILRYPNDQVLGELDSVLNNLVLEVRIRKRELEKKVPCEGDLGVAPQISLDTRNAKTADFFLREYSKNIDFINDVSSLEDSDMAEILVQHSGWQGELILTHHRGIPASKKDPERKTNPQIIDEIIEFFQLRLKKLETLGFQKTRVILDPGLGFGKNTTENLLIIQKINQLKEAFDLKILVGHSRKRFVTDFFFLDSDPDLKSKDLASHNLALVLASKNIDIIRSHEIKILKSLLNLSF